MQVLPSKIHIFLGNILQLPFFFAGQNHWKKTNMAMSQNPPQVP